MILISSNMKSRRNIFAYLMYCFFPPSKKDQLKLDITDYYKYTCIIFTSWIVTITYEFHNSNQLLFGSLN